MLLSLLCLSEKWRVHFPISFPDRYWMSALIPGNGLLQTVDSYGWYWPLFREPGYHALNGNDFLDLAMKVYCNAACLKFVVGDFAERAEMPKSHIEFFQSMRFSYHDPELDVLVVHAELPLRALQRRSVESAIRAVSMGDAYNSLVWGRKYLNRKPRFSTPIIHGHTQLRHHPLYAPGETLPRLIKGKMDLDTGAGAGGLLTAVILPEWKIVQQENLDF
jgi:hypothetical protein